jgi:hypothetical protein
MRAPNYPFEFKMHRCAHNSVCSLKQIKLKLSTLEYSVVLWYCLHVSIQMLEVYAGMQSCKYFVKFRIGYPSTLKIPRYDFLSCFCREYSTDNRTSVVRRDIHGHS